MVNFSNISSTHADESALVTVVTVAILVLVGALAVAFLLDKRAPRAKSVKRKKTAKKRAKR